MFVTRGCYYGDGLRRKNDCAKTELAHFVEGHPLTVRIEMERTIQDGCNSRAPLIRGVPLDFRSGTLRT